MPVKPTKEDLVDAVNRMIDDLIAPGLKVLFCGINPGLYSGATRLHFARPGNRFWKVLYQAGFTERLLDPSEEAELLKAGYGITCFVSRTRRGQMNSVERNFLKVERYCFRNSTPTNQECSPWLESVHIRRHSNGQEQMSACSKKRLARLGSGCFQIRAA